VCKGLDVSTKAASALLLLLLLLPAVVVPTEKLQYQRR